eukprot:COSAG05_NODE_9802_length_600_cov_1.247505_1_plen_29_part_01
MKFALSAKDVGEAREGAGRVREAQKREEA